MSVSNVSIEYALTRTSVRLMAGKHNEEPTSVGTGFFYKATHPSADFTKIMIMTNKHVIAGAEVVHFILSYADSIDNLDDYHQPVKRVDQTFILSLSDSVISHPDPAIDLCAIDITVLIGEILSSGKKLRSMFLDSSWLPSLEDKQNFRDIEQVLVVGYPRGLWDKHNNMPISRIGTTATHPLAMYQGKHDFLIDVAAFQGSSGSPVFSYESPMFRSSDNSYSPGTKATFIGIIWGVIESTVEGRLNLVEIPSSITNVTTMQSSLNLGIALHSDAVLAIDEIIFPKASKYHQKL